MIDKEIKILKWNQAIIYIAILTFFIVANILRSCEAMEINNKLDQLLPKTENEYCEDNEPEFSELRKSLMTLWEEKWDVIDALEIAREEVSMLDLTEEVYDDITRAIDKGLEWIKKEQQ